MGRSTMGSDDTSRVTEVAVGGRFSVYLLDKDGTGRQGTLCSLPTALHPGKLDPRKLLFSRLLAPLECGLGTTSFK